MSKLNRSFQMRVHLDTLFSRRTTSTKKHWAGGTFVSFAIIGFSDEIFSLKICPDPENNSITGIPLRAGFFMNFASEVKDACFENTAVQPNKWVDVMFFVEDRIDTNPWVDRTESSIVKLGHAQGELDGLTRVIQLSYNNPRGNVQSFDVENPRYNTGSLTANTYLTPKQFQIPAGFYGEVIGVQAKILTAMASGFLTLGAVNSGLTYTEASISSINYLADLLNSSDSAGTYDVRPINNATLTGVKSFDRGGVILNAGEIPILYNSSGSLPASADIVVYLMIRLKAIAGA